MTLAAKYPEELEALRNELRRWIVSKQFNQVSLEEGTNLPGDHDDDRDYSIMYIGKFVPESARAATLEVHISDMRAIGIGFDTREGIARRLAVKNHRQGFGDGFEPQRIDRGDLFLLLDLVSAGQVGIRARIIPWYGLGRTGVMLLGEETTAAAAFLERFYFSAAMRKASIAKKLQFEPWC
jgi:hypothetical protein